ncbi:unnamed protein product, partial [marine sediment metagenome]
MKIQLDLNGQVITLAVPEGVDPGVYADEVTASNAA